MRFFGRPGPFAVCRTGHAKDMFLYPLRSLPGIADDRDGQDRRRIVRGCSGALAVRENGAGRQIFAHYQKTGGGIKRVETRGGIELFSG